MNKKVLVVAAHPDDEVLGCGGSIAKHIDSGDVVNVLIMADGESSRANTSDINIKKRHGNAQKAAAILGLDPYIFLNYPDNKMDTVDFLDVVQSIESVLFDLKPEIIYTHYSKDLNIDHRIVAKATLTACRPQPVFFVKRFLQWETLSSTEWSDPSEKQFQPNWFVDISTQLDRKIEALKCYDDEMRLWPHARSYEAVKHLAKWRGATVGLDAAESFLLTRNLS